MLRTGIFSGTFNPLHIGHLIVANYILEYAELDEIWFLPTPENPLKGDVPKLNAQLRLEIVRKSIAHFDRFKVSDFEFSLPRPNYTLNTLRALEEKYSDRTFELIIGSDNWRNFEQWFAYEQLIANYRILVYPRKGASIENLPNNEHVVVVDAPEIEISSTFIREALRQDKEIPFFMAPGVFKEFKQQMKGELEEIFKQGDK